MGSNLEPIFYHFAMFAIIGQNKARFHLIVVTNESLGELWRQLYSSVAFSIYIPHTSEALLMKVESFFQAALFASFQMTPQQNIFRI